MTTWLMHTLAGSSRRHAVSRVRQNRPTHATLFIGDSCAALSRSRAILQPPAPSRTPVVTRLPRVPIVRVNALCDSTARVVGAADSGERWGRAGANGSRLSSVDCHPDSARAAQVPKRLPAAMAMTLTRLECLSRTIHKVSELDLRDQIHMAKDESTKLAATLPEPASP